MPVKTKRKTKARRKSKKIPTVATLASKVSSLTKEVKIFSPYSMCWATNISANYICLDLVQPQLWQNVFSKPKNFEEAPTVRIRSVALDCYLSLHTEANLRVDTTIYLVSLKANVGQRLVQDCGHNLGGLINGVHYQNNVAEGLTAALAYSGQVHLNKAIFNIHMTKRISVAARPAFHVPSAVQAKSTNLASTFVRFTKYLKWGKILTSQTTTGWKDGLDMADVPLGSRLYILAFTNDSYIDQESAKLSVNALIAMESA